MNGIGVYAAGVLPELIIVLAMTSLLFGGLLENVV
jgi:hypothetical protein